MNKIVFITFVLCIVASANANIFKNFADDRIYDAINIVLKQKYPGEEGVVECMDKSFREDKIADNFYSAELLTNTEKLAKEIEQYSDRAHAFCTVKDFVQSPLGIVVIIATILVLLAIFSVCGWCCCCRR